jgi:biopolymer transport protein ExbB/TolQ
MKYQESSEFLFQIFSLLISLIVVHAIYVGIVRPNAEAIQESQIERQFAGEQFVPKRSLYVVIKDYEQESCFILLLWALATMAYKGKRIYHEKLLLDMALIRVPLGGTILPEDSRELSRPIESLDPIQQDFLLSRTLLSALQRFGTTRNIQDASTTVRENCEAESDRLDSEMSMVRYIAWAIPSIGFIGTVRGIGEALGQAYQAVEGDITGVTASLGVAFNSTFVALILSIIIMFCLHQLQLSQERLVLDCQRYCDRCLLRNLAVR